MRRIFRSRPRRKVGSSRDEHVSRGTMGGGPTLESRRLVWAAIQEGIDKIDGTYIDYLRWIVNNTTMQFISGSAVVDMGLANERLEQLREEAICELVRRIEEHIPKP